MSNIVWTLDAETIVYTASVLVEGSLQELCGLMETDRGWYFTPAIPLPDYPCTDEGCDVLTDRAYTEEEAKEWAESTLLEGIRSEFWWMSSLLRAAQPNQPIFYGFAEKEPNSFSAGDMNVRLAEWEKDADVFSRFQNGPGHMSTSRVFTFRAGDILTRPAIKEHMEETLPEAEDKEELQAWIDALEGRK